MADGVGLSVGATNLTAVAIGRTAVTRSAVVTTFSEPAARGRGARRESQAELRRAWPGHHRLRRSRRRSGGHRGVRRQHAPRRGTARRGAARDALRGDQRAGRRRPGRGDASRRTGVRRRWMRCAAPCPRCREFAGAALVSDATAAVTALRDDPGLPTSGLIALCDFGGSGTSITLVDAANGSRTDRPDGPVHRVVR